MSATERASSEPPIPQTDSEPIGELPPLEETRRFFNSAVGLFNSIFVADGQVGHFGYPTPQLKLKRIESPRPRQQVVTAIVNIDAVGRELVRRPKYITAYLGHELQTRAVYDVLNKRALIDGEQDEVKLDYALANFIRKFVICTYCNCSDTYMNVDPHRANVFMNCMSCGASYSLMNQTRILAHSRIF